jgi:protein-S-isoprenylcysteine O-methyltransferase Ste14
VVQNADHPDVIAMPPYIALAFLLVGLALDAVWPAPFLPATAQYPVGLLLIAVGVTLLAAAVRRFSAASTNVPTARPATTIVTDGPYRFTRNPIYVAMAFGFTGIALTVDSLWLLALTAPLMAVIHRGVVLREERYLDHKFGDAYRRYRASVRRWI